MMSITSPSPWVSTRSWPPWTVIAPLSRSGRARTAACRTAARARRARPPGGRGRSSPGRAPRRAAPRPAPRPRRASEVETPNAAARSAGRCTVPSAAVKVTSAISAGSSCRMWTRSNCSFGRRCRRGAVVARHERAGEARAWRHADRCPPPGLLRAATSTSRSAKRREC